MNMKLTAGALNCNSRLMYRKINHPRRQIPARERTDGQFGPVCCRVLSQKLKAEVLLGAEGRRGEGAVVDITLEGCRGDRYSRCSYPYQLFIVLQSSLKYRSARAAWEAQFVSFCDTEQNSK